MQRHFKPRLFSDRPSPATLAASPALRSVPPRRREHTTGPTFSERRLPRDGRPPQASLCPPHARVKVARAERAAVVGQEPDDGIIAQRSVAKKRVETAHVLVNIRNHRQVARELLADGAGKTRLARLGDKCFHFFPILGRNEMRAVRRGGRQVAQEWFARLGGVTGELPALAVVPVSVIEVIVVPKIRRGTDV